MLREPDKPTRRDRKVIVEKAPASARTKGDLALVCGRDILTNEQVNILSVSAREKRFAGGERMSPKDASRPRADGISSPTSGLLFSQRERPHYSMYINGGWYRNCILAEYGLG